MYPQGYPTAPWEWKDNVFYELNNDTLFLPTDHMIKSIQIQGLCSYMAINLKIRKLCVVMQCQPILITRPEAYHHRVTAQ